MKTAVILFIGVLSVTKCQDKIFQTNLKRSLRELLIKRNSTADECMNQLNLLNDNLYGKKSSWANDSELKNTVFCFEMTINI
jgi:hypothetical protein